MYAISRWMLAPLATAVALNAAAQNGPVVNEQDTIEQVVVRGAYFGQRVAAGAKTPTLLVNTPQSISIVGLEQINDQAMTSMAELLQYSPGVSMGQGEDHRDQITLRGQNTTADFFIDGLRDDVQYFRPLYNLERVEILRGSNALLFGRGGGGGVINRVTKTADLTESFTEVAANLDSFGASTTALDTNLRIDGRQAVRLNAMMEGIENHRDFKDGDRWAVNPTYTLAISDQTRLVASWEMIDDERVVDRGNPSLRGRPLTGFDETFFGDPALNNTTFEGTISRLRVDHRFSDAWSANATAQYADYDKLYQNLYPIGFDDQAGTVSLDGYRDATDRENALLQFNLVGQFAALGVEHTLLTGFEYGSQDTANSRQDTFFFDSSDDQITFGFSDPLVVPDYRLTEAVRDRRSDVTFASAFIQDEIKVSERWIVVLGARIDDFEIDVVDQIEVNDGAADGNDGFLSSSDTEISPRAGLIYKPSDDLSFYLSLSRSFLPRSGDQFLTLTPTTASLAPEEFENQEVGVKWNASESFSVSAALFEIVRENGTAVDPNDPERSVLTGTETQGFELVVTGSPIAALNINASYTYLDGEELGRFSGGALANRTLAQLPENKFTLWGDYVINTAWRAGLGIVYQDAQFASLSNAVVLPSFTRVDAAVFWDVSPDLSLQLNIENLFDEEYFPDAHNDNNLSVGRPLNAQIGARYRF
jgi:catecholate siderophore receptor